MTEESKPKTHPKKRECIWCGLVVEGIPPWKKDECPGNFQHRLILLSDESERVRQVQTK